MDTNQDTGMVLPEGVHEMTPMEMNGVGFSKQHTVLTPDLLAKMGVKTTNTSSASPTAGE